MTDDDRKHWHLDRRVPVAIIGALLLQSFSVGWWAARMESRVSVVESAAARADASAQQRFAAIETRQLEADKLGARVDERFRALQDTLLRVESAVAPARGR